MVRKNIHTKKPKKKIGINKPREAQNGEHRCTQTQCSYYIGATGQCRACEKCGAPPYIINDSCERCYKCENVPNELRFRDEKGKKKVQEITEAIKEKVVLEAAMRVIQNRLKEIDKGKGRKIEVEVIAK